ncbi:1-deoxyxylulose-5-phosphate synthase YajO-like [Littorina saxatilis]|uniref:NADP-dependent oxidoreductase domain-containing protein n=1 Tax=Littorina saxatilis TaxID=31220 RepID=A0AAN9BAT4_9CAEN
MAAAIADEQRVVYNFIGKSGLRVSNICLGTLTFGSEGTTSRPGQNTEEYAHKVLNRFVEWGGNFIDTANVYATGKSEEIVGSWLQAKNERDRYVVATKVRFNMDPSNANQIGLGRRHITQAIEDSLRRLHTDYVDIYQMHCWDHGVPVEETLRTMHDLIRCGKVRYTGSSNVTGWQMQKLVAVADKLDIPPVATLQQQYNLLCRDGEMEAFQVCKIEGIGVLPWSPLKGGLLTGKFTRDATPTDGRIGWVAQNESRGSHSHPAWSKVKEDEKVWNVIDTCKRIGDAHGKSVAQVALRWLLQRDVVPSVIIGARTLEQLDQNMGAANGWAMTAQEMTELDEVSAPTLTHPHDLINKVNVARYNPWMPEYRVGNK